MPLIRETVSISQFSELLGVDPARLIGLRLDRPSSRVVVDLEPEDNVCRPGAHVGPGRCLCGKEIVMAQTSGTFPQLTKPGTRIGGKKGKR